MVSIQVVVLVLALAGGAWFLFGRSASSNSADRLAADPALVNGNKPAAALNGAPDTGRDFVAAMEQAVSLAFPVPRDRLPFLSLFQHSATWSSASGFRGG
jgi:hypothetical protein